MLKPENRLRKNRQFNYVYKHGEAKHTKLLSLAYTKTKYPPAKIGFTVSKKVGKSVVRSKVKRRLREAVKQLLPNINQNYNYIFIARTGIAELDFEQIKTSVMTLLKKAELYENIA